MRAPLSYFLSLFRELIYKICPLVIFEILGVSINKLTAKGKYPVRDIEQDIVRDIELPLPIKMQ